MTTPKSRYEITSHFQPGRTRSVPTDRSYARLKFPDMWLLEVRVRSDVPDSAKDTYVNTLVVYQRPSTIPRDKRVIMVGACHGRDGGPVMRALDQRKMTVPEAFWNTSTNVWLWEDYAGGFVQGNRDSYLWDVNDYIRRCYQLGLDEVKGDV